MQKTAPFGARRAPLLAKGCIITGRRHGQKGTLRCEKDGSVHVDGRDAVSVYKGAVVGEKGRF